MAAQHYVISNSGEFQLKWASLLAERGGVVCHDNLNEIVLQLNLPPLSCVLDMESLANPLIPNALVSLAKAAPLLLAFTKLTVEEELAWLAAGCVRVVRLICP